MQVTVAKTAGFCFGVRRALELTQKSAALSPTCTLGELIHNRKVVEELAGQGRYGDRASRGRPRRYRRGDPLPRGRTAGL